MFRIGNRQMALPEVAPGDAAQIQYTSGTTGFPKGAVLSHRSLTNNARFYAHRVGIGPESVWANFMPMFHTSGCGMITLGALQAGCPVFLVRMFDPAAVLRLIEREKVTAILGVPTMLVAMMECQDQQPFDLSSVEVAVSGGSMVAPELVRNAIARFGCTFQTVYGQTESAPLITQHHAGEPLDIVCNTAGLPMPQTEISIRSVDGQNRLLPVGEVGEICVRGYCVMIGYHENPSATAETIDAEGWLHTGDLGTLDRRGYLRITGRVKEMIIRGGENLFSCRDRERVAGASRRCRGRGGRPARRQMGRDRRLLRPAGAGPGIRPGGAAPPLPDPPLAAEDAGGLAPGRSLPAHRLRQDQEIRTGGRLSGGGGMNGRERLSKS